MEESVGLHIGQVLVNERGQNSCFTYRRRLKEGLPCHPATVRVIQFSWS